MKFNENASENNLRRANASLYKKASLSVSEIATTVITLFIVFLLVAEIYAMFVYEGTYIKEESMYPTLVGATDEDPDGGDYVIINKYKKPDYGDIVVVYNERDDKNIIKRVVAFGGDTVEMREGVLYLNGEMQEESYLHRENITPGKGINNFPPYEVKAGYIFIIGDNRDVSVDSRDRMLRNIEGFKEDSVKGVVTDWSMAMKPFLTGLYSIFN